YVPITVASPGDGITIYSGGPSQNQGNNIGGINPGENMFFGGAVLTPADNDSVYNEPNQFDGIRIVGPQSSFNQIHQSEIEHSGQDGIEIIDAPDNLIGDPNFALGGNVIGGPGKHLIPIIHGNTRNGIWIHSTDSNLFAARNRVQGNNIGGIGL